MFNELIVPDGSSLVDGAVTVKNLEDVKNIFKLEVGQEIDANTRVAINKVLTDAGLDADAVTAFYNSLKHVEASGKPVAIKGVIQAIYRNEPDETDAWRVFYTVVLRTKQDAHEVCENIVAHATVGMENPANLMYDNDGVQELNYGGVSGVSEGGRTLKFSITENVMNKVRLTTKQSIKLGLVARKAGEAIEGSRKTVKFNQIAIDYETTFVRGVVNTADALSEKYDLELAAIASSNRSDKAKELREASATKLFEANLEALNATQATVVSFNTLLGNNEDSFDL